MSAAGLLYKKARGCLFEFGAIEVFKRIAKECSRKSAPISLDPDISPLDQSLAIGAAPRSRPALDRLVEQGYDHIIDLRAERKADDVLNGPTQINMHAVPTYDDWLPKPIEFFQSLVRQIASIRAVPNHRLLICCGAGEHRAPLAGAVALVETGDPIEEAMSKIKAARPVAEFLPVYVASLQRYYDSSGDGPLAADPTQLKNKIQSTK